MRPIKNKKIQLYLGSGKRNIPGFVHVDLDDYPHLDYRHDIVDLPMFSDNSAGLIYHKTAYDFNSLKKMLQTAGFKNIHRYDWQKTIHKDYDDHSQAYVPHMDKKGILVSLNVEAKK